MESYNFCTVISSHPRGSASTDLRVPPLHPSEEQNLLFTDWHLRNNVPPRDFFIPSRWQQLEPADFSWMDAIDYRAFDKRVRRQPHIKKSQRLEYEMARYCCLQAGYTKKQTDKKIRQIQKFHRTQAFYRVQEQKKQRCWQRLVGLADANPFCLPGVLEEQVLREVCDNKVPKTFVPQPKVKREKKVRCWQPRPDWKVALESYQDDRLTIKWWRARKDWRQERHSRRNRMRVIRDYEIPKDLKDDLCAGWISHFVIEDRCPRKGAILKTESGTVRFDKNLHWQMEQDAHGEPGLAQIISSGDTTFVDAREESASNPLPNTGCSYAAYTHQNIPDLTQNSSERFFTFDNFDWKASDGENKQIKEYELPRFALDNFDNVANFKDFRQNVYWRGKMLIRVKVNSNLRQYGQLQVRFYYGANQEYNHELYRSNIYTGSQMPHCLITANASNSGVLEIPFEYIRPYLVVAQLAPGSSRSAILGRLKIAVIVPLNAVPATQQSCTVNVGIDFVEDEFVGQVYRGMIAQGPIKEIANGLADILNLDNPTNTQIGNVIVPQNVGSWSAGRDCSEWCVPLRLSPDAILPYGQGRIPNVDEMSIDHIVQIYGLVKKVYWASNYKAKKLLWSFDASPIWQSDDYPQVRIASRDCFVMPPVSVISSMFAYWRGPLRLRIDIVGAADLSGRIMIAYVPRCRSQPSFYEAQSCPYVVYDIQQNRQITYEIPFITDSLYWPRRYNIDRSGKYFEPPGKVFIYAYSDLIANNTIPDDCWLVCYLSAAPGFEVSVPCQPITALSFNTTVWLASDTKLRTSYKDGYYPAYPGQWHGFGSSTRYIMRYSEVSDHVAQMNVPDGKDMYKKILIPLSRYLCPIIVKENDRIIQKNADYFVLLPSEVGDWSPNYWYLVPFVTKEKAQIFVNNLDSERRADFAEPFVRVSQSYALPAQMQFSLSDLIPYETPSNSPEEKIEWQMDERSTSSTAIKPLSDIVHTGYGQTLLGEKFSDLKDICRRYQRYAYGSYDVDPRLAKDFQAIQLRFPAMPQGLDLDLGVQDKIKEYWNRTRDGLIPIVCSGYRFFTGGLRFRIIINTYDDHGNMIPAKLFVQHRPGYGGDVPVVTPTNPYWLTSSDLQMPGFAFHIQQELTNSIVSVSIPFYLPLMRIYLQRPQNTYSSSLNHSLGEIVIASQTSSNVKYTFDYDIYYKFDDDARCSVFQGFPPLFYIHTIADIKPDKLYLREKQTKSKRDVDTEKCEIELIEPTYSWTSKIENAYVAMHIPDSFDESIIPLLTRYKGFIHNKSTFYLKFLAQFNSMDSSTRKEEMRTILMLVHLYPQYFSDYIVTRNVQIRMLADFSNYMTQFPEYTIEFQNTLRLNHDRYQEILNFDEIYLTGQMFSIFKAAQNVSEFNIENLNETTDKAKEIIEEVKETIENVDKLTQTVQDKVDDLETSKFNDASTSVKEAADQIGDLASTIKKGLQYVGQLFEGKRDSDSEINLESLTNHFMSVIVNVSSFAYNPSISTFVSAVLNVLINFNLLNFSNVCKLVSPLTNLIKKLVSSNEPTEELVGQLEESDNILASYVSTLVAGVAGFFNFTHSLCKDSKRSLAKILLHDLKDFALTSNHLYIFCKNNIDLIKNAVEKFWKTKPDMAALSFLEDHDQEIFEWAKECLGLLDHTHRDSLFGNLVLASRVYECANQACLIQLKLLDLNSNQKRFSEFISKTQLDLITRLIKDICKLRDDLARAHVCPPVKFEPFVIHCYGEPGVGKSFIAQELPYALLNSIGYRSYNEITFVRTPGNAYWNGLSHQPVVIYDDWYQNKDPEFGSVQLVELLQLKTRAVFNPPMAAVEDKNIRYNPLIVILVSNCAFPKYNGVQNLQAIYRRVDALVHCRVRRNYVNSKVKDIDPSILQNYGHLEFCFHNNPNIEATVNTQTHITYNDFKEVMINLFRQYYRNELINYKTAIKRITSLYPKDGEEIFKLPAQQFWKTTSEYLKYVSKQEIQFNEHASKLMREWAKNQFSKFNDTYQKIINYLPFTGQMMEAEEKDLGKTLYVDEDVCVRITNVKDQVISDFKQEEESMFKIGIVSDIGTPINDDFYSSRDKCFHWWIYHQVAHDEATVEWHAERQQWFSSVNSILLDWGAIRERLYQQVSADVAVYDYDSQKWILKFNIPEIVILISILVGESYKKISAKPVQLSWFPFLLAKECSSNQQYYIWEKNEIAFAVIDGEEMIYFPHKNCSHPNCSFKERVQRNYFVSSYIQNSSYLSNIRNMGGCLEDEVPCEYFESSIGAIPIEVNEEKISWLKGFFKKFAGLFSISSVNKFYRIICKLSFFMLIISPVISAIFAVRTVLNSVKNQSEKLIDKSSLQTGPLLDYLKQNDKDAYNRLISSAINPQGFASGDPVHKGPSSTPKAVASKFLKGGQMNTEEFESLEKVILRNTFFLVQDGDDSYRIGRCLGIFGHCAILPTHYWEAFTKHPYDPMYFIPAQHPLAIQINLKDLKFYELDDSSLGVVILPLNFDKFKDIKSRFASEYEHSKMNGVCTIIEVDKPKERTINCTPKHTTVIAKFKKRMSCLGDSSFSDFMVGDAYQYDYFTGKGKCGSILIAMNLPKGIIGMHVAGGASSGVSEAITSETVLYLFEKFGKGPEFLEPMLGQFDSYTRLPDCQVRVLGRVDPSLAHRESEKSRIVPSLIQQKASREDFPVYTDVAVLSPRDKRLEKPFSPMHEGVKFHGCPLKTMPGMGSAEVEADLENLYLTNCKPVRRDVGKLSKIEACRGIDGVESFESLEWRTSEGFPFVAMRPRGVHDKKWLFKFDESNRCESISPQLLSVMKEKKAQRLADVVPVTVFTDCLKDTTISKEKVLQPGKTRVFSMAPVDFTIQQRQLTMDFSAAMMKNRLKLEHAVGINPDSEEWAELAQSLLGKGNKIVTGDYSKFGDTIPLPIVKCFFKIISKWYNKYSENNSVKEDQQRKIMAHELGQALHLMFDVLYRCINGQPSGNALTVLLNSFANSYYLRLAWLVIMDNTLYAGLSNFKKYVCIFSYGDDLILSVHDCVIEMFNAQSLHDFFQTYGLKFTNADKSDVIVPWTFLEQADFLKRSFLLHPFESRRRFGLLLAPLGRESIEDTINWVWNSGYSSIDERSPDFVNMCLQVCEDASRNAWSRGPDYYNHFCNKLKMFWSNQGVYVVYDSWEALDHKIFDLNLDINEHKSTIPKLRI